MSLSDNSVICGILHGRFIRRKKVVKVKYRTIAGGIREADTSLQSTQQNGFSFGNPNRSHGDEALTQLGPLSRGAFISTQPARSNG